MVANGGRLSCVSKMGWVGGTVQEIRFAWWVPHTFPTVPVLTTEALVCGTHTSNFSSHLQYPFLEARGSVPESLKKALLTFENVSTSPLPVVHVVTCPLLFCARGTACCWSQSRPIDRLIDSLVF